MRGERQRYISYLLRLWQTERAGTLVWHASLESPTTGERHGFASLAGLYTFLGQETAPADGEAPCAPVCDDSDGLQMPTPSCGGMLSYHTQNRRRHTMIIARHIFTAKEGRLEETVESVKWWTKRFPPPHASRLYLPIEGAPSNVIVEDEEFESTAEWERLLERIKNDPDFESAYAKVRELLDDLQFQLWEVVELK